MIQNEINSINRQLAVYTHNLFDENQKQTAIDHIFSILKNQGIEVPLSHSTLKDENIFKIYTKNDDIFYFYLIIDSIENKYDIFASILTIDQYEDLESLFDYSEEFAEAITDWTEDDNNFPNRVTKSGG